MEKKGLLEREKRNTIIRDRNHYNRVVDFYRDKKIKDFTEEEKIRVMQRNCFFEETEDNYVQKWGRFWNVGPWEQEEE